METLGFGANGWGGQLLAGTLLTIELALTTLPFGFALGLGLALMKNARSKLLRAIGEGFTTAFRGLPELLTLLLIYYGSSIAIRTVGEWMGYSVNLELSPFIAGVIALGAVFAAYSSEVLLGALRGIDRGQIEAGLSLGLRPFPLFLKVIFPQLLRPALPGLGNCWLALLKETSLVSVIALDDILRQAYLASGQTKQPFLFYAAACTIYLLLTMLSSTVLIALERYANRGWGHAR